MGQAALGTLVMGLLVWGWLALAAGQTALAVIGGALIGGGGYGLVSLAQGLPEARQLWGAALRRARGFVSR